MGVRKAIQAIEETDDHAVDGMEFHEFDTNNMIKVILGLDDPSYIVYQRNNNRYVELVRFSDKGVKTALVPFDFDEHKSSFSVNGYEGGVYNVAVTVYDPVSLDDYLKKPENEIIYDKKRDTPQSGSGSILPSHLNGTPFANMLSQTGNDVKGSCSYRSTSDGADYMDADKKLREEQSTESFSLSTDSELHGARKAENTADDGGVVYSLRIKHSDGAIEEIADARSVSDDDVLKYLRLAKSGELFGKTYFPVRSYTPQVIIDTLRANDIDVENLSLVMQTKKARQAMGLDTNNRKKHGNGARKHNLTPGDIIEIINNLDNPTTIIHQTNRVGKNGEPLHDNVAVFVEYHNGEGLAVVELDAEIDSEFINEEFGESNFHTVVTVFEPDIERSGMPYDYVAELLEDRNNFELEIVRSQNPEDATQEKHPNIFDEPASSTSISDAADKSNRKKSQNFKAGSNGEPLGKGQQFSLSTDSKLHGARKAENTADDGGEGVQYDVKTTSYEGKSLTLNSEVYSYDFLVNLPDMMVVEMPALSAVKTGNKVDRQKAIDMGLRNAAQVGRKVSDSICAVTNRYSGREIRVSQTGLGHSLDGENVGRLRTNARLSAIGGYIIQNAVPLNALKSKNPQARGTYAMAALLKSGDKDVVAIVTIEQHTDKVTGIDYVDVAHSINGRLRAKKESSWSSTRESGSNPATATFTISVADFLEIVKSTHRSILSQDVLLHFGAEKDSDGYYSDKTLFSLKGVADDSDSAYTEGRKQYTMKGSSEHGKRKHLASEQRAKTDKPNDTGRNRGGTVDDAGGNRGIQGETLESGISLNDGERREIRKIIFAAIGGTVEGERKFETLGADRIMAQILSTPSDDRGYDQTLTEGYPGLKFSDISRIRKIAKPAEKLSAKKTLTAEDREYISALKSDRSKAERMVREAAERAGYRLLQFHFTPETTFTVFKFGEFGFHVGTLSQASYIGDGREGRTLKLYIRANNPLYWHIDQGHWSARNFAETMDPDDAFSEFPNEEEIRARVREIGNNDRVYDANDELREYLKSLGFDSVMYENTQDREDGGPIEESYILFDSEQLKSADLETYDDDGNLIPLSQRFDAEQEDIRFSLKGESDLLRENARLRKANAAVQADEVCQGGRKESGQVHPTAFA